MSTPDAPLVPPLPPPPEEVAVGRGASGPSPCGLATAAQHDSASPLPLSGAGSGEGNGGGLPSAESGLEGETAVVDDLVSQFGRDRGQVIPLLHALQEHFRYLPQAALERVCEITDITPAQIAGVCTFYARFRLQPVGEHVISVCHGTACHVKGASLVSEALRRELKLEEGQDTTSDGLWTLSRVDCLGCCTLAPVVQIDGITYGHLTPEGIGRMLRDFLELKRRGALTPAPREDGRPVGSLAEIRIGVGSCCVAGGSLDVRTALEETARELGALVTVKPVGCVGMCHQTPLVEVELPGQEPVVYARVQPADAPGIVRRHFAPRGVLRKVRARLSERLDHLLTDETWEPVTRYALEVRDGPVCTFLGPQQHLATEGYGDLDPLDLDEYLAHGGFTALREAVLHHTPDTIIDTVEQSGLRGRGGAGFPTGRKWRLVRTTPADRKYVVCNGDEGDPGAFMDRMLLESYPYRILEGLAIAARAVGAREAIFYIRHEYPLAVKRIREAVARCEERGLLGDHLYGSDFCLRVRLLEGAGAFVCGEETGLLASLEGRRGMPRLRPPYPAQQGYQGRPTCVNNVETLALVPWIIRQGAADFRGHGTSQSPGTKVFSLTGKVQRGGLIEVPMGTTIRQIVEEIGGGVGEGRTFKAVQIGGPSGGCLPASLADTPVDFEALTAAGAIMGSGGLVVMDDQDCMVDVARYFLEFTQRESCGKCTFCRLGTRRMLDLLEGICTGHGKAADLEELEELGRMVKRGSLCGLGQTAPNPILTTLRYFRPEYEAHLRRKCPAGRCKALLTYSITEQCIGCTRCAQSCPADAIALKPYERHLIDIRQCLRCGTCEQVCPVGAVRRG